MNLIKFLFLGALISLVFGEFFHLPFGNSTTAIYVADLLLVLSFTTFFVWKITQKEKILIPKIFKYLTFFLCFGAISLLISLLFFTPTEVILGSLYLLRFILYSAILLLSFNLFRKNLKRDFLLFILFRVTLLLTILGFAQFIFYPDFNIPEYSLTQFGFDPHIDRLTSTFLDPNFFGIFITFNLGVLLAFNKVRYSLPLFITAIIVTYSRSAYLSLFIIFIFWAISIRNKYSFRKKVIGLLLIIAITALIISLNPKIMERVSGGIMIDKSAKERLISYRNGLEIFEQNPITGIGFNNLRAAQKKHNTLKEYSVDGGHSGAGIDSSLLTVLTTTGFLGLSFYLLFWFKALTQIKNIMLLGSFIGLIISSQFVNGLFYPPLMLVYFTTLGLVCYLSTDSS